MWDTSITLEGTRILLDSVFKSFLLRKPFCVMARAALERMLSVSGLDALFRQVASVQYERDLLFSGLVDLIARVVTRVDRSVLKASESLQEVLGVSDEAVYPKLQGIETCVFQALVRDRFREASAVLTKLGVAETSWVPGRRVKIRDGNPLQAGEHRIAGRRAIWDAPLPGTALVVWDPPTRLIKRRVPH